MYGESTQSACVCEHTTAERARSRYIPTTNHTHRPPALAGPAVCAFCLFFVRAAALVNFRWTGQYLHTGEGVICGTSNALFSSDLLRLVSSQFCIVHISYFTREPQSGVFRSSSIYIWVESSFVWSRAVRKIRCGEPGTNF